jgi:hypothetical protein
MIKEEIAATGLVNFVLTKQTGEVIKWTEKNLVVTTGKGFVASRMVGTGAAVMSHMAVGTSSTAAAAGQTTLSTEIGRVALTSGTASAAVVTYSATFPAGTGTGALVEAAIFNAASAGTMLCRTVFNSIGKDAGDTLTINWQVTII